jgi:hypothetical protein
MGQIGQSQLGNVLRYVTLTAVATRATVTRGLRVLREQLFLRLLLTTCRASEYTLDLESCLGTLRQS